MSKESTVMQDSLYVNWHLLDGLNHNCPYSHEPDSVINERFYREPLLETAYRLLSLNRPEYVFHLYGGEPTIHPYFKDLVGYIATSGRNVRMILETNGIRLLKYYLSLLEPIAPKCLCVRFAVHLKYMELENALKFVGLVTDQKHLCQVILNWVPEYDEKAHLFYDKFTKFQRVNTFGVSVVFPMGGSAPWLENYAEQHKAVEPVFPSWTTVPGADGEKDAQSADGSGEGFAGSGDNLILEFADEVSVVGVHAVQVAADGSCTLGLVNDDEPFAPKILQGAALRDDLPKAPGFESGEEAKSWLSDFTKRALAYEIDGGPVRNPLGNEGLEQEVRFKLKRLAPLSNSQRKLKIYPELWLERKEEILKVFEALADGASRDVLLRRLKAQLFGQSAYFVRSDYAEFCHPSLSGIPFEADGSHRRLRFENVKAGELKELRAKIAWYKPALEIVLPTSPEWLDILAELANTLPDYNLYLGQHGIKTVAYAKSAKPRKRYHPIPLRTLDGNPLVSVIVKAAYDEEELGKTIDSIEREGLPRYEIILVQDNPVMSETLEEFVRKNPWHVRAFRFNDDLSLSGAYDAGLDMAQGEYVCFLRCGDCVRDGALKEAVETLETEQADLLIFSREPACCMEGKTALSRYLTGELKTQGVSNKIYRTNVIHNYAIEIMDLPGNMEDDLFNLPMLHFSGKVVCQNGDLVIREEREDYDEDEPTANERFDVFIKRLGRILDFCRANGIALDSPALKAHILRLFEEVEDDFASLVHEADESGTLGEFLTHDVLASIKIIPDIASRLFRKCLEWQGKREDLPKVVMVDSTALETPFEEYAGVAKNYEHEPKLSFVITVSGSESLSLLESLAQENMAS
ncbi:MAG: glycosyltransferase, partial [Desulfovibrionaceae bacterium]|nr:glycosyltransferase [Desulfovibrionaceae bacterium]